MTQELPDNPDFSPFAVLAAAVQANDSSAVERVLNRFPQLKSKLNEPAKEFAFGGTALLEAVGRGNRALVELLLDAGADPNVRSDWWAGSFGVLDSADVELATLLRKRGARLDVHSASRLGLLDELKQMVAKDAELVHARGGDGQTPLHFAATVEIARFLLEHGAAIDRRDIDHESTPAQYMIHDRQDVARYLVERGCQTDILMAAALGDLPLVKRELERNPLAIRMSVSMEWFPKRNQKSGGTIYIWTLGWNKTAHTVARAFHHAAVEQFLLEHSPAAIRLAKTAEAGDEAAFHSFLESQPNLISQLAAPDLAELPNAAQNRKLTAVRLMLDAGWPVAARQGEGGATALHWAAWHGSVDLLREILKHAPPLELKDAEFHATPLGWALHGSEHGWHRERGDYPAVVGDLLAAGAKPPKLDEAKATEPVLGVLRRHVEGQAR